MTDHRRKSDRWANYTDLTANKGPSEFFEHAMATIEGDTGGGRLVIDLGCGAGVETRAFLARGWSVLAIDSEPRAIEVLRASIPESAVPPLETEVAEFGEIPLPPADLVYAQLSLPFAGGQLESATRWALGAVRRGGWFIGQFIGPRDTWAREDWVETVTEEQLRDLLAEFDPLNVIEEEFDGDSSIGAKHWHWFRVEALRA